MDDTWIIEQEIDLQYGAQYPQVWPNTLMLCGDNQAHTWRVAIKSAGKAAQLVGSVTGYFVRPDGNTVPVPGTLTGNIATVTLKQACYAFEGDLQAVMRMYSDGKLITLAALILPVRNVLTDSIIDPGNLIPSLDELLDKISACESATVAAKEATDAAKNAEIERANAESARVSAENTRNQQESSRQSAETERANAETARVSAENSRNQQESNRHSAEVERANAETARVSAENSRNQQESSRQSAETARVSAEESRKKAEDERIAAEQQRSALGFCVQDGKLCVVYHT